MVLLPADWGELIITRGEPRVCFHTCCCIGRANALSYLRFLNSEQEVFAYDAESLVNSGCSKYRMEHFFSYLLPRQRRSAGGDGALKIEITDTPVTCIADQNFVKGSYLIALGVINYYKFLAANDNLLFARHNPSLLCVAEVIPLLSSCRSGFSFKRITTAGGRGWGQLPFPFPLLPWKGYHDALYVKRPNWPNSS